jgi:hypothetical protein
MNTSLAASSVGGTATATFYAFKASRGEGRGEEVVVVALNSWLGKEEGWLDAKADVLNLPDGTVADLDPASVHKCYANFDPAFWKILEVITCPAKPDAQDAKTEIADAWKQNGSARVPWSFDRDDNMLVLHPVTVLDESDTIRLNLTHRKPSPTSSKDRPSSWQGITADPSVSVWSQEEKQQLSMIVSGEQPIECFRVRSETTPNDGHNQLNKIPITLRVEALSKPLSMHGSSLMYEERHPSKRDVSESWSCLEVNHVRDRCDKPHPDGSLYLERVGKEGSWSVVGRSIIHVKSDQPEPVKEGSGRNFHNIYYKLQSDEGSVTYGRLYGGFKRSTKILEKGLVDEITSSGVKAALTDPQGLTYNVLFSTSPEGLNTPNPLEARRSPSRLKAALPTSIGDHHLVFDLCDSARTHHSSHFPDS